MVYVLQFLLYIGRQSRALSRVRGHHSLAVRLSRPEQMEQVRDLLAAHQAYLMKYVDTWTVTDLTPSR